MKIIKVSNFDDDLVSDVLVEEGLEEAEGTARVDALNEDVGDHDKYFYRLVPDDYVLYEFEP